MDIWRGKSGLRSSMSNSDSASEVPSLVHIRAYEDYLWLLKQCLTGSLYDESAWQILGSQPSLRDIPWRNHVRRPLRFLRLAIYEGLQKCARSFSLLIVETRPFDLKQRENGKDWPLVGYTMVGLQRLNNIQTLAESILRESIPGDFIETGAWRGGATIFMRAVLKAWGVTDRKVWVADSFEGLPTPNTKRHGQYAGKDLSHNKTLKVSLDEVKGNFRRFNLLDEQVQFLKGWFCDSLPKAPIEKIAMLRLDGDLYESAIDALDALYSRVSNGGYVIVDDYHTWPSCKMAVDDFLASHGIQASVVNIDGSAVYWRVRQHGHSPVSDSTKK